MLNRLFYVSSQLISQNSRRFIPLQWYSTEEIPVKPSTTLIGLPVVTNPREVIEFLANKILDEVRTIPECYYRSEVEAMARNRLKIATEEKDWRRIEERLGNTLHVEEIIDEMEDELSLIPEARAAKIWDVSPDHRVSITLENSPLFLEDEDIEHDAVTDPSEIKVSSARPQSDLESLFKPEVLPRVIRVDPHQEDPEITTLFSQVENPEKFY